MMSLGFRIEIYVKLIQIKNKVNQLLISRRLIVSVVPRCISVPLNQYGPSNIEAKFFRTRFLKRPYIRLGSAF